MSKGKSQIFILDADSWISSYEQRYLPEVFPKLWDILRGHAADEVIRTPRQALKETGEGKSGLSAWLRTVQPTIVLKETPRVVSSMNRVTERIPSLTRGIEDSAAPWLVAHALNLSSAVVVTEETPSTGGNPKIPDVCASFEVPSITMVTMFRRFSICWKWASPVHRN